jgi:hypothetical protein
MSITTNSNTADDAIFDNDSDVTDVDTGAVGNPEAEVKRVPGAGHSVQGDRLVELRRTIAAFGWGTPGRGLTPRARVTRWHRMVLPRR